MKKRDNRGTKKMIIAMKSVLEKEMGLNKAATFFSVTKATLQRISLLEVSPDEAVCRRLERKPVMSDEMEKELATNLLTMESKFCGLTIEDVRRLAYQQCENHFQWTRRKSLA